MTNLQPRYHPGDRIGGRYQIHKALLGGMGEVYLCLDLEEMVPYALKTFQPRYQSTALRKAFEQEVATWVALEKHPNIVRCYHMDILDHQPFMILEWIAGEEGKGADLRGWLRHGPLDLQTALADYERAIELNPADASVYLILGISLATTGHPRESLPYLEQAVRLGHESANQVIALVRQMMGDSVPEPQSNPTQAAFEAFQQAASAEEMRQAVAQYPFMIQADFIAAMEQVIAQQVPAQQRPYFEQRLGWLRQIAGN